MCEREIQTDRQTDRQTQTDRTGAGTQAQNVTEYPGSHIHRHRQGHTHTHKDTQRHTHRDETLAPILSRKGDSKLRGGGGGDDVEERRKTNCEKFSKLNATELGLFLVPLGLFQGSFGDTADMMTWRRAAGETLGPSKHHTV